MISNNPFFTTQGYMKDNYSSNRNIFLQKGKKMVDFLDEGVYNIHYNVRKLTHTTTPHTGKTMKKFIVTIAAALTLVGCNLPEEGTIVYDMDYPRADEQVGGSGSSGGSTGGGDDSSGTTGGTDGGDDGGTTGGTDSGGTSGDGGSTGDGAGSTGGDDGGSTGGDGGATGDGSGDGGDGGSTGGDGGGGAGTGGDGSSGGGTGTDGGDGGDGAGTGGDGTDPEPEVSPVDNETTTITAEAAAYTNNVSWNALDGAEGYTVYYSTSSPAFPSGFTSSFDNTTTSFSHTGLDADTTYYYQVVATHTLGDSNESNVASATPYADLTGVTPELVAGAVDTDILVSWKAIDGASGYRLYYSTVAPAYPGGAAVEVAGTTYTLVKPDVETTYYFQVRALATGGNSNISNMDDAIVTIDCPDCGDPEIGAPTINVTADVAKNVVRWDAVTGAVSYNVYWNTASFPQGNTPQAVTNTTNTVFAHNALDSNTFYFYRVAAVDASNNEFFSNLVYSRPHGTECNAITPATDDDPDLLAYYAFEGNLNDTQGMYNLTTLGGEIGGYVDNCLTGTGGYFDGKGGYGYNMDFRDDAVVGLMDNTWSISVWANADEDMAQYSSVLSTTAVKGEGTGVADDWDNGFQIDVNSDRELRWFFSKTGNPVNAISSNTAITLGEWYHITVTYDNGVGRLYVNGVELGVQTGLDLGFNRIKVGVNRIGRENWKGYIDDLKVFGRTLSPAEVVEQYEGILPAKVENVAAINLGNNIGITWDAVEGVGTYRVYYSTSGNPTVADSFFQVQNATSTMYPNAVADGVTYYFRVAGVNNIGAGELSTATNESSTTVTSL